MRVALSQTRLTAVQSRPRPSARPAARESRVSASRTPSRRARRPAFVRAVVTAVSAVTRSFHNGRDVVMSRVRPSRRDERR
ncbi:hypothetical protein JTE90_012061 [Oedothorax gibbosus]|uniref:Uncharacterized protein n=1 Tax=Oedothorax gibbosus TaxID=931172 RepID=A0AAV6TDV6_9ARAC|nr:hypothetical protein JTE90_012061 [Oedothorax gibbosus]